ncbi:hypothetical protein HDU93_007631 [Gonapodya sp. JEL0774]|nr:hypothetical protein HDU93_007631 [Gonapodya sp. JEL0774]
MSVKILKAYSNTSNRVPALLDGEVLPYGPGSEVVSGRFATWNISKKMLGSGSFAVVKEAINMDTGDKAVVKICTVVNPSDDPTHQNLYPLRELGTLSHVGILRHPNIVRLLDGTTIGDSVYIFEERIEGMELFEYLKQNGGSLPIEQVRNITAQLLSALRHIHRLGVLHRDVKLDNVIINTQTLHITLIDFNLATFYRDDTPLSEPVGCINYSSPQILDASKGKSYLPEKGWSDLWALGVATYGMMVGFFPFKAEEARRLIKEQSQLSTKPLSWHAEEVDPVARAFVESILTPHSLGKISAETLMQDPFVAGHEALKIDPLADAVEHPFESLVAEDRGLVCEDLEDQATSLRKLVRSMVDVVVQKLEASGVILPIRDSFSSQSMSTDLSTRTVSQSTVGSFMSFSSTGTVVAVSEKKTRRKWKVFGSQETEPKPGKQKDLEGLGIFGKLLNRKKI